MSEIIQRMMEIPSYQYGAYESSFDRFPDERRWAKRFALYKLRGLIRSLASQYDVVAVRDLSIMELKPDLECGMCISDEPYTWGWKCRFILANKI